MIFFTVSDIFYCRLFFFTVKKLTVKIVLTDYVYCNDISNVANEKATTGDKNRASDLDSYPTGNLPTYDEALKIESMTKNELRRRISSQQSIKSDDFKAAQDSNSYDCPVYSP